VAHLEAGNGNTPSAGVSVCVYGRVDLPCVLTDEDGTYEHLCIPEGDVGILFSKEGFASTLSLRVFVASIGQTVSGFIVNDADNARVFQAAGATYPRPGYGLVTVNDSRDRDGMVATAVGTGVDGPFYSPDGATIVSNGTGTTGQGLVFFLAPVGSLKIELHGPSAGACQEDLGGWASVDSTITLPVAENTETTVLVRCP
jgi:hypothetical protein